MRIMVCRCGRYKHDQQVGKNDKSLGIPHIKNLDRRSAERIVMAQTKREDARDVREEVCLMVTEAEGGPIVRRATEAVPKTVENERTLGSYVAGEPPYSSSTLSV